MGFDCQVPDHCFSFSLPNTVEFQWLEHLWDHEISSRQGKFELMSVNHSTRSGGIIGIYFRFSLT